MHFSGSIASDSNTGSRHSAAAMSGADELCGQLRCAVDLTVGPWQRLGFDMVVVDNGFLWLQPSLILFSFPLEIPNGTADHKGKPRLQHRKPGDNYRVQQKLISQEKRRGSHGSKGGREAGVSINQTGSSKPWERKPAEKLQQPKRRKGEERESSTHQNMLTSHLISELNISS
ncbi:hypothetical protein MA16_Dca009787 [Dendrobium catenatum]|uniref:Uncharacterized protein n=1 Tax=Dendrobium catenatum TaxID=906689 RepID=A0A2I0XI84_9ASPA|nr:hypothetical protein MA16_Dca009787 [Dendrobium catenatum]